MDIVAFAGDQATLLSGDDGGLQQAYTFLNPTTAPLENTTRRFIWVDVDLHEITADVDMWQNLVCKLTGCRILDLHLQDALNAGHPSYYDSTEYYDMVVFRKLNTLPSANTGTSSTTRPVRAFRRASNDVDLALAHIETQPVTSFAFPNVLLTIRHEKSFTIEQIRQRLLTVGQAKPTNHTAQAQRLPLQPEDLLLRLLNGMVDRYLDLRTPLSQSLDHWQKVLLNTQQPANWQGLLDIRSLLRKLEYLCEEQHDAVQEFRDSLLEAHATKGVAETDVILVRTHDVIEHIARVLTHVRRLEDSIESAVQIHFSALAHRTNNTMRVLTLITAFFMPLTLITGIFGMNFEVMPWLKHPDGFYWSIALMSILVIVMGILFYLKRYFDRI